MNKVSNIQSVLGDKTNSLDENLIKQDFGVWTASLILVFCRVCQHGCGPPVSIYQILQSEEVGYVLAIILT